MSPKITLNLPKIVKKWQKNIIPSIFFIKFACFYEKYYIILNITKRPVWTLQKVLYWGSLPVEMNKFGR